MSAQTLISVLAPAKFLGKVFSVMGRKEKGGEGGGRLCLNFAGIITPLPSSSSSVHAKMINAKRAPRGGIQRRLQKTKRAVFRPCDTWRRCTFAKDKFRCWQIFSRNICPVVNSSRGIFPLPFSLVSLAEEGRISPSSSPLSSFPQRLRGGKKKRGGENKSLWLLPLPPAAATDALSFFAASPHFPSVRRPVCTI